MRATLQGNNMYKIHTYVDPRPSEGIYCFMYVSSQLCAIASGYELEKNSTKNARFIGLRV